jgi:hypothetical protein
MCVVSTPPVLIKIYGVQNRVPRAAAGTGGDCGGATEKFAKVLTWLAWFAPLIVAIVFGIYTSSMSESKETPPTRILLPTNVVPKHYGRREH